MIYSEYLDNPLSLHLLLLSAGGSGPGQDGERRGDPGGETPRQERLHEEVQGGTQPGRRRVDRRQGGQHHQAQGWSDMSDPTD